jgi:inosine-uridine nucleoside N-ribohydrolase
LLIAAGVALTAALGVFNWLVVALAIAVLAVDGVLLYSSYIIGPAAAPKLTQMEAVPAEDRIAVVYDCDLTMGRPFRDVGDGLALLYLLGEPKIDLRAVTTTYGNGPVDMTTRTTRRLLKQLKLGSVEVVRGAARFTRDPTENEAARFLVDHVNAHPREVVLLATGAMTNLKHAASLDGGFFQKLRGLCLVGGVTGRVSWNGRRLLERNFSVDPEAAYQAIQAPCPKTIVLGEAGLTAVFRSQQMAALRALDDSVSDLILKRSRLWFGLMRLWFRDDGFAMWESVGAIAIAHPAYLRFEQAHLPTTVEDLRTGLLVTDPDRTAPARLVRSVEDYEAFISVQLAAWHRLGRPVEPDGKGVL